MRAAADTGRGPTRSRVPRRWRGCDCRDRNHSHSQKENSHSQYKWTDRRGPCIADYTYDPYGNTIATGGSAPTTSNNFGYNGGLKVGDGLYHFGARYYDPSLARWTQPDPLALSLASDPTQNDAYAFAGDDPVNDGDASGLCSLPFGCIADAATDFYDVVSTPLKEISTVDAFDSFNKLDPSVYIHAWRCGRELAGWQGGEADAGDCDPFNYIPPGNVSEAK